MEAITISPTLFLKALVSKINIYEPVHKIWFFQHRQPAKAQALRICQGCHGQGKISGK